MEIEEIRDIIRFAGSYYSNDLAPLDLKSLSSDDSNISAFYKMLSETKIHNDQEAAELIYQDRRSKSKYMYLKSNFTTRSLNSIASLDLQKPGISDLTRAVNKSYKNLFVISILMQLGSRRGAISLAKKTLNLTEKFELHHVSIELLEQLRTHALQQGKRTEYEKYLKKLEKELAVLTSFSKVKTAEERILIHSARSIYIDESLQEEAQHSLKEMEAELAKHDDYLIQMAVFRMQYMYFQLIGNPLKSVQACNSAISYMESMPHMTNRNRFGEFELYKLENYILAHDYQRGKESAKICGTYYSAGSNNWFTYKGFHFILLMHTLKFDEAQAIHEEVTGHKRFPAQPEHLRERWNLFKFYLNYLIDENEDQKHQTSGRSLRSIQSKDRYKKKIDEFPTYSADKRGLNVSILIMNILLLLENNNRDRLLQQVEALATYRNSHLKGKNSHQSAILFRLILLMVRCDFDPAVLKKKAYTLEKRLRNTRPSPTEIFECVQVLPPDWIWARMKEAMEHYAD